MTGGSAVGRYTEEQKRAALAELREEKLVRAARRDRIAMLEYTMRTEHGEPWVLQKFHVEWQDLIPRKLNTGAAIAIEAPRDHAKTSQVSGALLDLMGCFPTIRIKYFTNSDDKAADTGRFLQSNIKNNPRLRRVYPHLKPTEGEGSWTPHKFWISRTVQDDTLDDVESRDATFEGRGIFTSATSGRADLIWADDVCDWRNSVANPADRERVKSAMRENIINLLEPGGILICTFTPWHEDDYNMSEIVAKCREERDGLLYAISNVGGRESINWVLWQRPAEDGNFQNCLWSSKWGPEELRARKAQIGPRAYARGFLLKAISDEERMVTETAMDASLSRGSDIEIGVEYADSTWPRIAAIDLANALRKKPGKRVKDKGSFTACGSIALHPDLTRQPIDVFHAKPSFPQIMRMLRARNKQLGWRLLLVENNAFQQAVVEECGEDPELRAIVRGFTTGSAKSHEEFGIPGMVNSMERGLWMLPGLNHPSDCKCVCCLWRAELITYPNGKTTDLVMMQWLLEEAVRIYCGGQHRPISLTSSILEKRVANRKQPQPGGKRGRPRKKTGASIFDQEDRDEY